MAGKPKPPKLNLEALQLLKEAFDAPSRVHNRFVQLEARRSEGILNTPFIAFEAITALLGLHNQGFGADEIRRSWLDEWDDDSIEIPAAVLAALVHPWVTYKEGPSGKTLGEHFFIEGGGSGSPPMKSRNAKLDERVKLSNEVTIEYLEASESEPISLEEAKHRVAQRNNVSFDTVHNACKANKPRLEEKLKEIGLILG